MRAEYNPLITEVRALPRPVVVAVEGACVGAGLGLALCADLRVAARGARFATAFTGIDLAADSGLSAAPAQAVGPSRAAALLLLGDRFDAEAAERWGLVHQVVPDGAAADRGLDLARQLAAGPTAAYAEVKALLRSSGRRRPARGAGGGGRCPGTAGRDGGPPWRRPRLPGRAGTLFHGQLNGLQHLPGPENLVIS